MGCGASSANGDEPADGAGAQRPPLQPRKSTMQLEQKIADAQDDPDELFKLQAERAERRKQGKLDGQRAETGNAGSIGMTST